jgi:hypothetical protein
MLQIGGYVNHHIKGLLIELILFFENNIESTNYENK